MTITTPETRDRDLRLWQIKDLAGRVKPEDMTDAELEAVNAILGLAEARLPGNRVRLRLTFREQQKRDWINPPDLVQP